MEKESSTNKISIKITVARPNEGVFLNKAYSIPLGFKPPTVDPALGNTLQVLSFFNKKCYIYDINRSGANLNRSIPFDISLLTGDSQKDHFHFNPTNKVLTFTNFLPFLEQEYGHLMGTLYNFSKSVAYDPSYTEIQFDNRLTEIESINRASINPEEFDVEMLGLLKHRLEIESPTFWRYGGIFRKERQAYILKLFSGIARAFRYRSASVPIHSKRSVRPPKLCFELKFWMRTCYEAFDPTGEIKLVFVAQRGFRTKRNNFKSRIKLIGVLLTTEVKIKLFDQTTKKVMRRFSLNPERIFSNVVRPGTGKLTIRKGGIGYDFKNDRLIAYEPEEYFYSIKNVSKSGPYGRESINFQKDLKTDKKFEEFILGLDNLEDWFWHGQLKPLIQEVIFGKEINELIWFDEKTTLAIDETSFRLLENQEKAGSFKEIWRHQFKLALKSNFVKTSRGVIASMTPDHLLIQLFNLENGLINLIKTIPVRSLSKSGQLPNRVKKGELIHFECPVSKKNKKQKGKKGFICLSYGKTIIKFDLSESFEVSGVNLIPKIPYVLATRNASNGDYIFLITQKKKFNYFTVLDSNLKEKVPKIKINISEEHKEDLKLMAGKNNFYLRYIKQNADQLAVAQPRVERETRFWENYPAYYEVYKSDVFESKGGSPATAIPQNEQIVSPFHHKYGFIVHERRVGEDHQKFNFLIFSGTSTPKRVKLLRNRAGIRGRLFDLFRLNQKFSIIETFAEEKSQRKRVFWLLDSKDNAVRELSFENDFEPFDFREFSRTVFLDFDDRNDRLVVMDFSSCVALTKGKKEAE